MTAAEQFARAAGRDVDPGLIAVLEAALATCANAHPDLEVDRGAFAAHLGARGAELPGEPALLDLHLAFAAAQRLPAALVRFERDVLPGAVAALRAMHVAETSLDEILQRVREKLIVGVGDGPPRVLDYRGDGRLRAWVRVVAVREMLMARRGRVDIHLCDAVLAATPDPNDDPGLGYARRHYRDELRTALASAVDKLTPGDRALLRYSLVDGLTLAEIAAIYRTHKATISRRLARARGALWEGTRAALSPTLGADTEELASVIRAVRTGLDLSLDRLL
jgi:RNA polymerase sigma-70 factor, ECF subfamily